MSAAVFAATKAMAALNVAMMVITRHPIIAALSAILGLVAGIATVAGFDLMAGGADKAANSTDELNKALADIEKNVGAGSSAMGDMANQMEDIAAQARKINEDYRYNLAQLVKSKNENIAALRETLDAEKKAYDNAYAERLAGFNKTQDKEEKSHTDKTKALQNQIDFLTKYDNEANRKQLTELQFALAQENAEYQKSTQLRQTEFDKQTQSAASEYEKRRAENQKKLNEELALLNKHRRDVLAVRGVMLRDEIEQLKFARDEQLKSLQKQRQTAANYGSSSGRAFGTNYKAALIKSAELTDAESKRVFGVGGGIRQTYKRADGTTEEVLTTRFATGGYTGAGGKGMSQPVSFTVGSTWLPKEQGQPINRATKRRSA